MLEDAQLLTSNGNPEHRDRKVAPILHEPCPQPQTTLVAVNFAYAACQHAPDVNDAVC